MNTVSPRYFRHRFPPETISHAVWLCRRFCLEVKAEVERVRREMAAERAAAATRRRARNEIAAAYRDVSSRTVPDGYSEGLKRLGLPQPLPTIRDDDGIPLPYETALQRR